MSMWCTARGGHRSDRRDWFAGQKVLLMKGNWEQGLRCCFGPRHVFVPVNNIFSTSPRSRQECGKLLLLAWGYIRWNSILIKLAAALLHFCMKNVKTCCRVGELQSFESSVQFLWYLTFTSLVQQLLKDYSAAIASRRKTKQVFHNNAHSMEKEWSVKIDLSKQIWNKTKSKWKKKKEIKCCKNNVCH